MSTGLKDHLNSGWVLDCPSPRDATILAAMYCDLLVFVKLVILASGGRDRGTNWGSHGFMTPSVSLEGQTSSLCSQEARPQV